MTVPREAQPWILVATADPNHTAIQSLTNVPNVMCNVAASLDSILIVLRAKQLNHLLAAIVIDLDTIGTEHPDELVICIAQLQSLPHFTGQILLCDGPAELRESLAGAGRIPPVQNENWMGLARPLTTIQVTNN